jgi:hypothetical protein
MPIQSKKQWRWMFANKPEMAHEWAHHTSTPYKKLPTRKKGHKKSAAFDRLVKRAGMSLTPDLLIKLADVISGGHGGNAPHSPHDTGDLYATRHDSPHMDGPSVPSNYRPADSTSRCSNCEYMDSDGTCTKYKVAVDRNYTCDSWSEVSAKQPSQTDLEDYPDGNHSGPGSYAGKSAALRALAWTMKRADGGGLSEPITPTASPVEEPPAMAGGSPPNYRPAATPDQACGSCVHYASNGCSLYGVNVQPDHVCDSFAPPTAPTMPTPPGMPQDASMAGGDQGAKTAALRALAPMIPLSVGRLHKRAEWPGAGTGMISSEMHPGEPASNPAQSITPAPAQPLVPANSGGTTSQPAQQQGGGQGQQQQQQAPPPQPGAFKPSPLFSVPHPPSEAAQWMQPIHSQFVQAAPAPDPGQQVADGTQMNTAQSLQKAARDLLGLCLIAGRLPTEKKAAGPMQGWPWMQQGGGWGMQGGWAMPGGMMGGPPPMMGPQGMPRGGMANMGGFPYMGMTPWSGMGWQGGFGGGAPQMQGGAQQSGAPRTAYRAFPGVQAGMRGIEPGPQQPAARAHGMAPDNIKPQGDPTHRTDYGRADPEIARLEDSLAQQKPGTPEYAKAKSLLEGRQRVFTDRATDETTPEGKAWAQVRDNPVQAQARQNQVKSMEAGQHYGAPVAGRNAVRGSGRPTGPLMLSEAGGGMHLGNSGTYTGKTKLSDPASVAVAKSDEPGAFKRWQAMKRQQGGEVYGQTAPRAPQAGQAAAPGTKLFNQKRPQPGAQMAQQPQPAAPAAPTAPAAPAAPAPAAAAPSAPAPAPKPAQAAPAAPAAQAAPAAPASNGGSGYYSVDEARKIMAGPGAGPVEPAKPAPTQAPAAATPPPAKPPAAAAGPKPAGGGGAAAPVGKAPAPNPGLAPHATATGM